MMAVRFTILVLLTTAVVVVSSAGLLGEQHENFFLAVLRGWTRSERTENSTFVAGKFE